MAMAWAIRQGLDNRERVYPVAFREMLAGILGSHDLDIPLGNKCHEGCSRPLNRSHASGQPRRYADPHPSSNPPRVP